MNLYILATFAGLFAALFMFGAARLKLFYFSGFTTCVTLITLRGLKML